MIEILEPIIFLLLLIITIFNFFKFNDILYPPVIQSGLWTFIIFMYLINKDHFYQISLLTYIVIISTTIAFSLGSFFITYDLIDKKKKKFNIDINDIKETLVSRLFFWLSLFVLPLFMYKAYNIAGSGPTDNLYINLRAALTWESASEGYGILAYIVPISYINVGIQLLFFLNKKHKLKYIVSLVVALTYAFLSTGRTFFMLLILFLIGISVISGKLSIKKAMIIIFTFMLFIFFYIGSKLGKISEHKSFVDSFKEYLLGPLPAYDYFLQTNTNIEYGLNTFRFLFKIFGKLGIDNITISQLIRDYSYIPMPINVYTVFYEYTKDFTVIGSIIILFLLGILHGYIYKKAKYGILIYIMLYGLFLYPLIMQFFQEQYFNLTSQWIQYIFYILVFVKSIKRNDLNAHT